MPSSWPTTRRSTSAFSKPSCAASAGPGLAGHVSRITDSLAMARSNFPGKSNSLDALCKRFEVNNAARQLHGALLDAGLLAEVYVRMTRGQESLVIEGADAFTAQDDHRIIDFGGPRAGRARGRAMPSSRRTSGCWPRSRRPAAAVACGPRPARIAMTQSAAAAVNPGRLAQG